MYIVVIALCITACAGYAERNSLDRIRLQKQERDLHVGGRITLTEAETAANEILMKWKEKEVNELYAHKKFNNSKRYFSYPNEIKSSKVYQIIREMPKGGALHVHSTLMLSARAMVALTYEEHLYVCATERLSFQFSRGAPQRPCNNKWQLLDRLRRASDNITQFDIDLQKHFTFSREDDGDLDINEVWKRFEQVVSTISSLISYRPVKEKHLYEGLREFYNDNVMYVEIRTGVSGLYELNGTVHDNHYPARLYDSVAQRFKRDHPGFIGVKMIVTKKRSITEQEAREVIDLAKNLKRELPHFIAGFDFVGQEDVGRPLKYFQQLLEEAKPEIDFYFHAGETNWFGSASDENLIDAILLGSKRIGHGYALIKHPALMSAVFEKDIAIEVNVISNLVLSLLSDVRSHPLASYLALGLPIVISSDDPGVWGADPLSSDFYVTFVAVASRHADLRMLKQLVNNSVKYSALDDITKEIMYKQLDVKWDEFIGNVIKHHNHNRSAITDSVDQRFSTGGPPTTRGRSKRHKRRWSASLAPDL